MMFRLANVRLAYALLFSALLLGCSGKEPGGGNKIGSKVAARKPVDDLFLAKNKDSKEHREFAGYMNKSGKIVLDLRQGLEYDGAKYTPTGYETNKNFLRLMPFVEGYAGFCLLSELGEEGASFSKYKKEQCGFLDKTGKIAVPPLYDDLMPFSEGLAAVAVDKSFSSGEKWGFVDAAGKVVVEPKYLRIGNFREGLAVVGDSEEKYGFIDKAGKAAVELKYSNVSAFSDGVAVTQDASGFALIDKTGKELKKLENLKVYAASNLLNYIYAPREVSGYSVTIAGSDKFLASFHDGLLPASKGENARAYISPDGTEKFIVASPYLKFAGVSAEGFIPVKFTDADIEGLKERVGADRVSDFLNCEYYDGAGKSPNKFYGDMTPFSEGLAGIIKHQDNQPDLWGFVNTKFEQSIPPRFAKISPFEGGLAYVRVPPDTSGFEAFKDTNWEGYIDTAGKPVAAQWP